MVVGGRPRGAAEDAGALRPRRRYIQSGSDDSEPSSTSDSTSEDDSEDSVSEPGEEERAVLESAMARIRRAQAKDKTQVKLSRVQLAALGRHRKREMQAEKRRQRRHNRRDRISVPIEHLETMSRSLAKLPTPGASGDDGSPPQRIPGSFHLEEGQGYPPVGFFPPPAVAPLRALPSSASQPILGSSRGGNGGGGGGGLDRQRSQSPFTYSYVRGASATASRHVSDPAAQSLAGRVDPFQYLTAGPRAPQFPSGAAAASRYGSSTTPGDRGPPARDPAAAPAAARGRRAPARQDTDEDDNSTASDDDDDDDDDDGGGDGGNGHHRRPAVHNTRSQARQNPGPRQSRRRDETAMDTYSDSDPEPEPQPAPQPEPPRTPERTRSAKTKKASRSSSSANTKRKSTGASSSGAPSLHSSRRRKGK